MTTYVRDTLTGAAGTDITVHSGETGALWTGHPFTAGLTPHVVIASGNKGVRGASDNYFAFLMASGDPGSADYDLVFVLKPRGAFDTRAGNIGAGVHGGLAGVLTKYSAADRTGYECLYTYTDGSHHWQLQKAVSGTITVLQDIAVTYVAGHTYTCTLKVRSTGHTLLVSDNGAAATTVFTDTDTSVTGNTRAGMTVAFFADDTDGMVIDSYSAATSPTITGVSVTPTSTTVGDGGTQTFTALVTGTDLFSTAVTWSVTGGGSINSSTGVYTAPGSGSGTATVTATSVQDGSKSGTASASYAAGLITAAVLSRGPISKANIKLTWTAASGGVAALTTNLKRSVSRFGSFADLGVVTGTSYTDTTADPHTVYDYELVTGDGTTTAISNQITAARTIPAAISLGWIGDSNYATGVSGRSTNIALEAAARLATSFGDRTVTLTNRSIGGTGIRDFQPSSTNLNNSISAFVSAGTTDVVLSHGYNDTYPLDSKAVFKANMSATIAALFAGVSTLQRVIIIAPLYLWIDPSSASPGFSNDPDVRNPLLVQYNAASAELHNGVSIFYAGDDPFLYSGLHPEWYTIDSKVHLNDTGCQAMGRIDGDLVAAAAFGIESTVVGTFPTVAQVITGITFGPTNNLTGTVVQPTAAQVLSGISFGPSGSPLTGTVVVPTTGQVASGVTFGAASALTGTLASPTAAQVLLGVTFGAAGALTGTVVQPTAGQVQSGVHFGPGSGLTGTYTGPPAPPPPPPPTGTPATLVRAIVNSAAALAPNVQVEVQFVSGSSLMTGPAFSLGFFEDGVSRFTLPAASPVSVGSSSVLAVVVEITIPDDAPFIADAEPLALIITGTTGESQKLDAVGVAA